MGDSCLSWMIVRLWLIVLWLMARLFQICKELDYVVFR